MKARHWAEAGVLGTLLTAAYFWSLRSFGIGYGGGLATLILTVPALAWLYALARWARHEGADWVWFSRRYRAADLYQLLWPGLFGGAAFLLITLYFKASPLRPAFFAGWLFPILGAATAWSFWNDRHNART